MCYVGNGSGTVPYIFYHEINIRGGTQAIPCGKIFIGRCFIICAMVYFAFYSNVKWEPWVVRMPSRQSLLNSIDIALRSTPK